MSDRDRLMPLFPLGTVLLPGGPLMLRIFETRYLDMVSRCMRDDSGFAVVLLRDGAEVGPATFHEVGTVAKIADWHQYDDGLLGITAVGQGRMQVLESSRQADGLNVARVRLLPPETSVALPQEFAYMARLLEQLLEQLGHQYALIPERMDDANWVACRLAEILPMSNDDKQACLEMSEPSRRLALVAEAIRVMTDQNS